MGVSYTRKNMVNENFNEQSVNASESLSLPPSPTSQLKSPVPVSVKMYMFSLGEGSVLAFPEAVFSCVPVRQYRQW